MYRVQYSMHASRWKESGYNISLFGNIFHLSQVKLAQRLLIRSVVRIRLPLSPSLVLFF